MNDGINVILIEQEDKEKIELHHCVTCMWVGHKGTQFPRPTCVKLYDYKERCMQICEECLEKIYQQYKEIRK